MTFSFDRIKTEPADDGLPRYRAYVDGAWTTSQDDQWLPVSYPHDASTLAWVPSLTAEDVDRAIASAHAHRTTIRAIPAVKRLEVLEHASHLLRERFDELLDVVIRESGKPKAVAKGEVKATIERMVLTAQEARTMRGEYIPGDWVEDTAGKFAVVRRQPRGVVACITPFNYPLFIAAAKVAPALVAGNTVVVKPSTETPLSMLYFAAAMEEAGLPPGTLQIVTGRGSSIGDRIAASPLIDMISFTGSTQVGERIASQAGMKHLALELGGKGAALVLLDADLEVAVSETARGGLRFQGQRCDAVDRILVQTPVADEFASRLVKEVEMKYPMGDPVKDDTAVGPLINERAAQYVDELVQDAVGKGAKVLLGGNRHGAYYEPTVLDHVTKDMRIAWEETFGPVLPIMRLDTVEEMVEVANTSEYALDSSVFTRQLDKAWGIARHLEDGAVTINGYPAHGVGHFPFGGNKKSGLGREGIHASIEEMTRLQTIVVKLPPAHTPYGPVDPEFAGG